MVSRTLFQVKSRDSHAWAVPQLGGGPHVHALCLLPTGLHKHQKAALASCLLRHAAFMHIPPAASSHVRQGGPAATRQRRLMRAAPYCLQLLQALTGRQPSDPIGFSLPHQNRHHRKGMVQCHTSNRSNGLETCAPAHRRCAALCPWLGSSCPPAPAPLHMMKPSALPCLLQE